jgi:tetratricopeptide (TPR) repeat protein
VKASRAIPVVLAATALLAGCAARTPAPGVDPEAVSRVVGDVMSAQVRIGMDERLAAVDELEVFLTHTDLHSERVAQALEDLGNLYLTIELNTYARRSAANGGQATFDHDRSILLYRKVLADYPDRSANHGVYYQLARAYADLGDTARERAMLQALVDRAPHGPYLAEARYRLGELAFDAGRFKRAAALYDAALATEDADERLKDFAAYKRAWADYLIPDYAAGERAAVDFVDLHRVPRGGGLVLDSQALAEPDWERVREVILILARMIHARGGVDALEAVAGNRDYLPMLYERLGEVSGQLGRAPDAVAVYEAFLARHAEAPEVPAFLGHVIDTYTDARDVGAAVRVRERLVATCAPGTPWWEAQSAATRVAVEPVVRETAFRLARHHHSVAQEKKTAPTYARAAAAYRDYLARYGDSREAPEARFLLGEILFESGDFAGAAAAYEGAAYGEAPYRRAGEAAYATVYARERLLAETKPEDPRYDERLAALVAAFDRMVRAHPEEPRLESAYGRIAGLLFDRKDDARLYDMSDTVIRFGPRTLSLHTVAWRNLGEAALGLGRYEQAEGALTQALQYAADDPQESVEIRKLLAATAAARASAPGVTDAEAGESLLAAADRLGPDDPLGRAARVDAGMAFMKAGDEARAVAVFGAFVAQFPQDPQRDRVARAVLQMGESALERGDPEAAAAAWDRYLTWFKGEWPDRDRLVARNRARTHLAAGDLASADRAFTVQLDSYPPGQAPEELVDRLAGVRYKRAADLIERKDPEGLAVLQGIADDLPNSRVAPKALDAIVQSAGSVGAAPAVAVGAALMLVARHPDTPEAEAARDRYPDLLIDAGRPLEAAAALVARADDLPRDEAAGRLRRAAGIYEAEGRPDLAAEALEKLRAPLEPGSDPWVAASVDIARLREAGTTKLPERAEAPDLNGRVDTRLLAALTPLAEADSLGPAGRRLAAEIWLARADAARERFMAVELVPPLDANLKAKQAALKDALAAYGEAAEFRSRDATLSATRRMGDLLEGFARAMLDAPVPGELTPAQVEIYRGALKKRAAPYLARSVQAHERNLARAREGLTGPDVDASLAALGRLKPEWYDRPELEVRPIHVP